MADITPRVVDMGRSVADNFMEYAMVLDKDFIQIDILDTFESFYWTERYNASGDFELIMPVIEKHLPSIRINNYLAIRESEKLMIIESVTLETDAEEGDKLVVSGRSLESILDRRIVWSKYETTNRVQTIILDLINQNAVTPSDPNRVIPGLFFLWSGESEVTTPTETVTYFGDNLYTVVSGLCEAHNLGFYILPSEDKKFKMGLYAGIDRSWEQTKVPPVVFSHSYENLLDSNYIQTEVNYISNALVRGDEDDVTMGVYRKSERIGLARREMFIDTALQPETQDIVTLEPVVDENGEPVLDPDTKEPTYIEHTETIKIYDQDYYNRMLAEAKVELSQHNITEAFDSEVDTMRQFFFGEDYNIGDIVQVENRYGFEARCRVTEVMRSRDVSGPKLIPTFVMVDISGNEVIS